MKAIETIIGSATAPGTTDTALTMLAGFSNRVRDSKSVRLISVASFRQAAGFASVRSPLMHDSTIGIRVAANVGVQYANMAVPQDLVPQDDLVLSATGSGTAGDVELNAYTIEYEGLAGIDGSFGTHKEVQNRIEQIYSFPLALVGVVGGGLGVQAAINSTVDQLYANREYAILGVGVNNSVAGIFGVTIQSPDWGQLQVMAMGQQGIVPKHTYFFDMARDLEIASIPIFNASQKQSVLVRSVTNEVPGASTETVFVNCALLAVKGRK